MLTKAFVVSGSQQEIIVRYKPFLVSLTQSNHYTSVANLVMRGRMGFFRYTPQFHITVKMDERDGRTYIILRLFPNLSFWLVLLFCLFVTVSFLTSMLYNEMISKTASIFLLFPLSIAILDVLELWWQTADCMDRLQDIANRQGDG